ncbi:hypothetical protein LMH87_010443 [Akanthomyces muscarius]|uniref:Uncharacterized protein n=1 Tax=Akanthomyces muscarius TaxID=2231603 RepID=A0A9W8QGP4_AKAMU|nr:hypothetical protein LMH87_010443 [Akanthomyces muscarius]KAJ4153979.1 hypothetical protein LMH87_010443 [Akanthomyces muscarius]
MLGYAGKRFAASKAILSDDKTVKKLLASLIAASHQTLSLHSPVWSIDSRLPSNGYPNDESLICQVFVHAKLLAVASLRPARLSHA